MIKVLIFRTQSIIEARDTPALERIVKEVERTFSQAKQYHPNQEFILEAESQFNNLLNKKPEALAILKKAFESNKNSSFIALRLANVFEANEEFANGAAVLKEALSFNSNDKDLNFKYATLLSKLPEVNYTEVIHHLRRSFTKGDSRYQAQFWYARALYLSNEISEAMAIFSSLRSVSLDVKVKNFPKGRIKEGGQVTRYKGTISELEYNFGYIKRDIAGDNIYFYRYHGDSSNWENFNRRDRVSFTIAFNFHGPIAVEIHHEKFTVAHTSEKIKTNM